MCLAVPGKVVSLSEDPVMGLSGDVNFSGVLKKISFLYTPEVQVDDYVTVHAGFALSILDQEKATEVFNLLNELRHS